MSEPTPFLDRVIGRSAFPTVVDAERERLKVNLVRIGVGAIMLYRTALIVFATYYYHPTDVAAGQVTAKFWLGCGMLALLGAYTAGFLTPLVGLALILTYPYFDMRLLTGTLGTNVASVCLITLFLLNAGSRFSIDGYLLNRNSVVGRMWRALYGVMGFPDARQTARIYFLAFAAYAVMSLGALGYHIGDAYWREGRTVGVMLTNAYLSRHYELFRAWESAAPGLYGAFSALSILGQSLFQALMLPLVFFVWGRRFVVVWGAVFFGISAACLQLSYLPYLELALWALIFVRLPAAYARAASLPLGQPRRWQSAYTAVVIAGFVLFLFVWFAPGGRAWSGKAWDRPLRVLAWFGLDAPQVFNDADLRMGERWPVIERVGPDGDRALVPLNGADGERLGYHKSDLLYFGNSLQWRRRMIGEDVQAYNAPGATGYEQIKEVCYYDFARAGGKTGSVYEVRVFENRSARSDVPPEERYERREVLAFDVAIGPPAAVSGD